MTVALAAPPLLFLCALVALLPACLGPGTLKGALPGDAPGDPPPSLSALSARWSASRLGASGASVYVAANLFDADALLPQWQGALLALSRALRGRVFVSIVSGGRGGAELAALSAALTAAGVGHSFAVSPPTPGDWRSWCVALSDAPARAACAAAPRCGASDELRHCGAALRIALMAVLRNAALRPLLGVAVPNALSYTPPAPPAPPLPPAPPDEAPHLGLSGPVSVLFLNDVLLYTDAMLELLLTADGAYDMACGLDFSGLKLYDTWVARDLSGAAFSEWLPWARERGAAAALRAGAPARVFSCWNGGVALPAAPLLRDGLRFRSWREGEPRGGAAGGEVYEAATCPASECALLCADLWAAGRGVIYVNPRVRFSYSAATEVLSRALLPAAEALLLRWSNRADAPHPALRAGRGPRGTEVRWPPGEQPRHPDHVDCGLSEPALL